MADNYGVSDIKHLDTRDAMRKKVPMYLGSDDINGTYQALKEIINNSTDESIAGFGDKICILLNEESNEVTVRDYGRGVPFGIVDGKNILVAIYTEAHTGGKFDENAYKNVAGLNGIGGTAVCMTSEKFMVRSVRDGKTACAVFEKGLLKDYSECSEKEWKKASGQNFDGTGTVVSFKPDMDVFINCEGETYSYDRICSEVQNISYLNKGVHFIVETTSGKKKEFYSENGIADFIKDKVKNPLMVNPIIVTKYDANDQVEIAFMWTGDSAQSYVFVNGLYCPEGGSPITGAKTAITTSMKRLGGKDFDPDIIRRGLVYAINCRVAHPSFEGQTKSKINNANLRVLASAAFKQGLEDFSHTSEFTSIVEMIAKFQRAEKAAEKARIAALNQQKKMTELRKQKVAYINKLTDAENLGQNATLCIVEGDSAGNAVAEGRDTKDYGIMRIRGKMKNGLKETDEQAYYENKEIELLLYALGVDPNKYDPKKLRYGKIAICVDADDDGFHIALLIIANLYRLCPKFLEENRLYWLRSPLFIERDKNNNMMSCYYTDEEFDKVRGTLKGNVKRVKGLGQLNDKDLKATMFSKTGNQRMDQIIYSKEGVEQLCLLMGIDIQPRKDFVFSQIDFSNYGAV